MVGGLPVGDFIFGLDPLGRDAVDRMATIDHFFPNPSDELKRTQEGSMAMGCGDRHESEPGVWVIPDGRSFRGGDRCSCSSARCPQDSIFSRTRLGFHRWIPQSWGTSAGIPQWGSPRLGSELGVTIHPRPSLGAMASWVPDDRQTKFVLAECRWSRRRSPKDSPPTFPGIARSD